MHVDTSKGFDEEALRVGALRKDAQTGELIVTVQLNPKWEPMWEGDRHTEKYGSQERTIYKFLPLKMNEFMEQWRAQQAAKIAEESRLQSLSNSSDS